MSVPGKFRECISFLGLAVCAEFSRCLRMGIPSEFEGPRAVSCPFLGVGPVFVCCLQGEINEFLPGRSVAGIVCGPDLV